MASIDAKVAARVAVQAELCAICDAAAAKYGVARMTEAFNRVGLNDEHTFKLALAEGQLALTKFLLSVIDSATAKKSKGGE